MQQPHRREIASPQPGEANSAPRPPSSGLTSLIIPSLHRIIKSSSWRKHSKLASQCKSLIENFPSPHLPPSSPTSPCSSLSGPLDDYSIADSEVILSPLLAAASSGFLKIADPALDCLRNLIAHGHLHGEVDSDSESAPDIKLLVRVIESVCKCVELGDAAAELLVLRTLLSAVTSTTLRIHGDCLLRMVRTCYDLCLGSKTEVNQKTAKASLIQILVIVFGRMEADSSTVPVQPIVVAEVMDPGEKGGGRGQRNVNMTQFVQGFITKIISGIDVVLNPGMPRGGGGWEMHDGAFELTTVENMNPTDLLDSTDKDMLDAKYWEISMYKTALEGRKGELGLDGEGDEGDEGDGGLGVQIGSKMRRDAFLVFRALCKLSMKSLPKESLSDPAQMRVKIVALELLKILLENAGAVFRTSERFLGAIKQYLCLSLLKNSASPLMIVFQLSCSIFMSLVSRFRPGLKADIGVFFPMIILRVLENVAQHNFQQKMIVLRFLEKLCVDSQILVDVFTNYDCDANSSNIFERIVTGLLKTAQGAPPGVATTLLPHQEASMKLEAMKCLVEILKSMGDWMNKQLQIPDPQSPQKVDAFEDSIDGVTDVPVADGSTETSEELESKSDAEIGASDAASVEQRQDYKLVLEEGISLFNCKPKKGIDFLIVAKRVGKSPDEIATFLRNTSGLNKTVIGDYLGEREEMSLKVMHAYVDSFKFQGIDFDEAIRLFLQDFRLPGEAQKIDYIMEKFAEHYCKCNPKAFSSADTAYVLAYSVIMLNTNAHNSMVKNKMTADDFIRSNLGIDGGGDLPEEYMRSLHGHILKNEIKTKEDCLTPQHNHSTNSPQMLGLDGILNIVIRKQEDKSTTREHLIPQMQEQFKEEACKSESAYYPATDVVILRFMIEVCWAPMLAAFSVPLDQSDDEVVISLCLEGFHHAIHVTAVMCMKTHRDVFVTSLAKFTSLHSAADIKQKNIDAIKAIVTIADEEGNYLQEAWEHILTCVSRFEHLRLLGEGVPPDVAFFALPQINSQKSKQMKSSILPVLKKKGPQRFQHPASVVRRGPYDSAGVGGHASGLVTSEQVNKLVSNLSILEKIGPSEMNRIFMRSQKLNSEAVLDFVRALCKVSMEELRSTSDPRVFSLTKIVEIAQYNMNRIRLVWSSVWHILTDFFVTIGCSENLSIAIFAMDSLRQLSMKFLEREELTNYNFQNEFMKPFVIVMRKSRAVEIRELIIRCISQVILTHVKNIKSGWKSIFMVFSTASYDEHKYIVLLAFEIIEKIVRDYFSFITDTDTTTFAVFVNCLITFMNTKFNKDISLNALAFLRFCVLKLAEGEAARNRNKEDSRKIIQSSQVERSGKSKCPQFSDKGQHVYFWFPLLAGLSEFMFDLRSEIRKGAMEILFETLRNHGHLFSLPLWESVFDSVLFPIFDHVRHAIDPSGGSYVQGFENHANEDQDAWLYETCTLTFQLVVDLFVNFYDTVNPLLRKVLTLLTSFISQLHQSLAGIGIAAFVRLMNNAGSLFSEEKWLEVVSSLKEAAIATLPDFSQIENLSHVTMLNRENDGNNAAEYQRSRMLYFAIADAKCRSSVQLLLIQAVMEIYNICRPQLSIRNTLILFQALHAVASHAQEINSDNRLRSRLKDLGSMTQMQDPPLLRLENESFQICLTLLQNGIMDQPSNDGEVEVEEHLVNLCKEVLQLYLNTTKSSLHAGPNSSAQPANLWLIPLDSAKRRELASRAPLIVATFQAICGLGVSSIQKNLAHFFPLITGLISCEHGSNEVPVALSNMLSTCVGPALLHTC